VIQSELSSGVSRIDFFVAELISSSFNIPVQFWKQNKESDATLRPRVGCRAPGQQLGAGFGISHFAEEDLRKRFYILFVTRDTEGELRKIHIPLHYLYVFLAGAVIGMLTITGMAGSYARMLVKTAHFNQLRTEKEQLKTRYSKLEQVAQERDIQVASLGSLASEVSALYGLKSEPLLTPTEQLGEDQLRGSIDQLSALRHSALTGAAAVGISISLERQVTTSDWVLLASSPTLWPVEGRITSPFGARIDPFNGEGAFHRGVDISTSYGRPIVAPADGVVSFAEFANGYGRMVMMDHGHGISTRYGHLSAFAVTEGQALKRGDVLGYVGLSGHSTGPHLHYEVWMHGTPVNPYKYLRTTSAQMRHLSSAD
jgi:murein DD-endopeptidase MepM/ murein hydrolase activator NlpD